MMVSPDVSIIIVNWNTRQLLHDCLQSLCHQGSPPVLQIIVVDNGSTDGSLEMVAAHYPSVEVIANGRNLGFSKANNIGFTQASGRHVFFLNSDTVVQPQAIERLVQYLDHHPEVGAVGPQLLNEDGTLQPSGRPLPGLRDAWRAIIPLSSARRTQVKSDLEKRNYSENAQVGELSGAALMVRRSVLDQVGIFDEAFFFLGEDIDLCWRIHKAGWQVVYLPAARVVHLWGGSSQGLSEKNSLLAQRAYLRLMQKHGRVMDGVWFTILALAATILKGVKRMTTGLIRGNLSAAGDSLQSHLREMFWLLRNGWRGREN